MDAKRKKSRLLGGNTFKGYFKPTNPKKYKGNVKDIMYMSGWEFKFMMELDSDPNVIQWSSEPFPIPYISPVTNRIARYFPDFWVMRKMPDGSVEEYLIEIKPAAQTKPPVQGKKKKKTFLKEVMTWGINERKWKSARAYAESKGMYFRLITEKELKIK